MLASAWNVHDVSDCIEPKSNSQTADRKENCPSNSLGEGFYRDMDMSSFNEKFKFEFNLKIMKKLKLFVKRLS